MRNGPDTAGLTCHRRRQLRLGMGDLGVLGFDFAIQRFSLGNDAAAQILQQAHGRAFDQIQRRTGL